MKTDKVLETFKSKREVYHISEIPDEILAEIEAAEWGKVSGRGTEVTELPEGKDLESEDLKYFNEKLTKARTLNDIKISDQLNTLDVDPKNTVGNVIEPDKEIDWKDVKDKG